MEVICAEREDECFFNPGWTGQIRLNCLNKFGFWLRQMLRNLDSAKQRKLSAAAVASKQFIDYVKTHPEDGYSI